MADRYFCSSMFSCSSDRSSDDMANLIYQCVNTTLFASLAVWNIAEGWHWACYILIGQGVGISGVEFA